LSDVALDWTVLPFGATSDYLHPRRPVIGATPLMEVVVSRGNDSSNAAVAIGASAFRSSGVSFAALATPCPTSGDRRVAVPITGGSVSSMFGRLHYAQPAGWIGTSQLGV